MLNCNMPVFIHLGTADWNWKGESQRTILLMNLNAKLRSKQANNMKIMVWEMLGPVIGCDISVAEYIVYKLLSIR